MGASVLDHLREQLAHRYRVLERSLTDGLSHAEAVSRLGSRPTAAWQTHHIGGAIASTHRAVVDDEPGAWTAALGDSWREPESAGEWDALRTAVLGGADALLGGLGRVRDEDLERPPRVEIHAAFRASLRTRRAFLEGHLYHVTYHLGALGVLRAEFAFGGRGG